MTEESAISSLRLGIDAYRKAQGKSGHTHLASKSSVRSHPAANADALADPSNPSARELKSSVLQSLHRQSNSGMVSMRDVAVALDHLLKRG